MSRNGTDRITICMGSSCHSRGNRENLELLREWLCRKSHVPEEQIELKGTLCCGKCSSGPHLSLNKDEPLPSRTGLLEQWLRKRFFSEGAGGPDEPNPELT